MGALPPFDINHLVRLRDVGEGRPDHASRFIGSECRVAVYAYVHGMDAFTRREPVGTLSFLRLMCEATIQVRWLCGDEDTGTESGQLRVDAPTVRLRAQQLEKRDVLQMLSAYTAVHGATNGEGALREDLAKHIAQFDAPPAPATVKDLATSWSARAM